MNLDALRRCNVDSCRTRPDGSTLHAISCRHDNPEVMDLIDEVERLRGLVACAHEFHWERLQSTSWCGGCDWNHERSAYCSEHSIGDTDECACAGDCPEREWFALEFFDTEAEAMEAHAAHVAALLDGGAS